MLECAIANAISMSGVPPDLPKANPVDVMYRALLTCELAKLEKVVHAYQNDPNGLLSLIEGLGRKVNSRELVVTGKKFSWRRGTTTKWGVACEFKLLKAERILLLLTEPEFPSIVLEYKPGTAGTRICESPALLAKQVGKIAGLPTYFAPPPLVCAV
jgi:hypothetical protein